MSCSWGPSTSRWHRWGVGDSYDNALAETIIGLFKTELIHQQGPWKNVEDVEFATWVDWFNNRRLLGPIGDVPLSEKEAAYYHAAGRVGHGGLTQLNEPLENPGRFNSEEYQVRQLQVENRSV